MSIKDPIPKVAVLSINTGNYDTFFEVLFPYMALNFLPDCDVHFFVYTDSIRLQQQFQHHPLVTIVAHKYEPWPMTTLKRFHTFIACPNTKELLHDYDYIFFLNANYFCKRPIYAKDLLIPTSQLQHNQHDLILLTHAFQSLLPSSQRSYERNPQSTAHMPIARSQEYSTYVMGSFIGGTSQAFMILTDKLIQRINADLEHQVIATWHDESHLNRYVYDLNYNCHILPPTFGCPQEYHLTSHYIGDRDKYYAVLLNKKALPSDPQLVRTRQQTNDIKFIQHLIYNEREIEHMFLANAQYYRDKAQQTDNFYFMSWQLHS